MAYDARSTTIGSAGAHHISRDIAVVRVRLLALGIGDDRNRHFAEYHTTASSILKSKDAIPVNYCLHTFMFLIKSRNLYSYRKKWDPIRQQWHTRRRNSARWERPNKLGGCILFDNRNCCVFLNSI
jgi:hypothetical protein